jgi:hypothetical protein
VLSLLRVQGKHEFRNTVPNGPSRHFAAAQQSRRTFYYKEPRDASADEIVFATSIARAAAIMIAAVPIRPRPGLRAG